MALMPLLENPSSETCTMSAMGNNGESLSNGSLMRATPMAVLGAGMQGMNPTKMEDYADLQEYVALDAGHTHPQKLVHDAIFLYCLAIGHLLRNPLEKDRA